MSSNRLWKTLALTLPFWLGVLVKVVLDHLEEPIPPLRLRISISAGNLILVSGLLLTGLLLSIYTIIWLRQQRAARAAAIVRRQAALLRYRFLLQLNHELKNPLMALQAGFAYLAGGPQVENYHQAIADLSLQVERIGRLVTDLRKLADLDEIVIEWQSVDLPELFAEVLEAAQSHPAYSEHNVQLLLLTDTGRLAQVPGDRGLLWLAFFNLVENALKFSPPGASIEVRMFETEKHVVVEVQDNGPGIAPEDLPLIFEELYRGANAYGTTGSGLGLPLVRRVLDRHNGRIMVHSRLNQGTVVTLHLAKERSSLVG